MATSVSAWKKPAAVAAGTWALDSEEHEEELIQQHHQHQHQQQEELIQSQPLSDFPSLSAAAVTKTKKKKPQTLSLAEFNNGKSVTHGSSNKGVASVKGLTPDELSRLPTGPRERSAEELEQRGRLGGGFKSYGSDRVGGGSRYGSSNGDDSSRWGRDRGERGGEGGFSREREPLPPSKADEVDDWGAMKKSMGGATSFDRRDSRGSERGERGGGGGGFFSDSRSRADEADNWLAKKSFTPSPVEPRRERRGGGGFESGYQRDIPIGGGADGDSWGKKRGEEVSESVGRPRLVLQPRSVPISNGEQQQQQQRPTSGSGSRPGSASGPKSNPFGAARPREEVLGERGEDWKKIDEHLEEMKIKEIQEIKEEPSFGKKSFGSGNGRMSSPEDRTERSWRRTSSVESPTPSVENVEHAENPDKDDDSVVSGN